MDGNDAPNASGCPVMHSGAKSATHGVRSNKDWWPNQLNLKILHQHSEKSDPLGADFNYAEAFKTLANRPNVPRTHLASRRYFDLSP